MIAVITMLVCFSSDYQWKPIDGTTQSVALWQDNVQIGSYCLKTGQYCRLAEDGTLKQESSPIGIPEEYAKKMREETGNYGLDWTKIQEKGEAYRINGKESSKGAAYGLLYGADDKLSDDSGHLRLTVIGSEEARKATLASIKKNKEFTALEKEVLIQLYPKDHWALTGKGFEVAIDGATIYLQKATGEVIYSGTDPKGMFDALGRLRGPQGPLDIKWSNLSLGINPFTWMIGLGWSSFRIPGELILLVMGLTFGFVLLKRS